MAYNDWRASSLLPPNSDFKVGLFAGLAGGLAEFIWIGAYCAVSGHNSANVAAQITQSIFPGTAQMAGAPVAGLAIHFGLSMLLGLALVIPMRIFARHGGAALMAASLLALAGIWAINFLIVLPVLNPIFPTLLPTWATFLSKLFFGAAFAVVAGKANGLFHLPSRARPEAIAGTGQA